MISKISPDERLGRRRPQADDNAGTHDSDFRFQPRAAGGLFPGTWLFMESPLAALLPVEVLHRIGDIDQSAAQAGLCQSVVKQSSGGTHKGPALTIFLVARRFTDQHQRGRRWPFAKDRLSGKLVKRATLTTFGRPLESREGLPPGQEIASCDREEPF